MKPLFFAYKMRTKAPKYKDLIFQRLLIERMQQLRFEHGYSQEDVIESTHLDISRYESGKFSYISKFHIVISCKLIVYIVMCFYQETN